MSAGFSTSELTPFDITADLPTGTVLLEASAGTGKTWTIGALVARHIAEGVVRLEDMLVITFGRAASREMRERVREHLRHVHRHIADPTLPTDDPVVALLREGTDDEVAARVRRLREALTHFDAATIATTHQFCQLVLRGLGVAGDSDPHSRLVDDLSDLRDEVVDDLYVRGFAQGGPPAFSRQRAGEIARAVTDNPHAQLDPSVLEGGTADARSLRFAHLVRAELDRRKRRQGVLGYDDLLSHLAAALEDEDSPARERMRQRWQVVLVDEFQDTDPVQWQILDRAFSGHSTLVLIGDPKQAIYGFRGGDVDTYLTASESAMTKHTLGVNHRSDGPLVRSLGVLLGGAQLGDSQIVVHPVSAARQDSRLGVADGIAPDGLLAPVRLRALPGERVLPPGERSVSIGTVRPLVAADCAAEITRLLTGRTTFDGRLLRAGDIAVLAHTRRQLDEVRSALTAVGLRSVIVSSDSIYDSPAATAWLTLLEAMELTHRPERVRAAALTPFVGLDARELDDRGDDVTEEVAHRLRTWAALLGRRGVAAVLAAATADGMDARVLARTDGERLLTDLRHIGETLHQRVVTESEGLASLTAWLRERMGATRKEERARRLDSDADAVHLATIHASKGLQYPIVMLPFVCDRWLPRPDVLHFHRADRTRCLDIGISSDEGRQDRLDRAAAEESGESLRLLYVAMTRAQSQVVTWWFPSAKNTGPSSLHRVLLGRSQGQGPVPRTHPVPGDATLQDQLTQWEQRGGLRVEYVDQPSPVAMARPETTTDLSVRGFTRTVDDDWRRTSYTALTRPLDDVARPAAEDLVASEPEVTDRQDDEGGTPLAVVGDGFAPSGGGEGPSLATGSDGHIPSPMADLPVGAGFGSLVHAVLEEADAQAPDLLAELRAHVEEQILSWPVPDLDRDALAEALVEVVRTPLGPLAPDTTLADIGARDRLCEMEFELPLGGGDAAPGPSTDQAVLGDLADLMRAHLPADDPVLPFADVLDDPLLGDQSLRGYLTGSVDIVLRVGQRHLVVDYKTNWLGPVDTPLTTQHYDPAALRAAMNHSSYPLQAILYGVVLHRFLRWRQPGYDPEVHFGGVLYLYLRGMAGPDTPIVDGHPTGVFAWQPPIALIEGVSDLLDGRRPVASGRSTSGPTTSEPSTAAPSTTTPEETR